MEAATADRAFFRGEFDKGGDHERRQRRPAGAGHGFSLNPDELEPLLSNRTKLIYLNFPSNPTGGVVSREQITALAGNRDAPVTAAGVGTGPVTAGRD